jgi:hypothetical protein
LAAAAVRWFVSRCVADYIARETFLLQQQQQQHTPSSPSACQVPGRLFAQFVAGTLLVCYNSDDKNCVHIHRKTRQHQTFYYTVNQNRIDN